MTDQSKTLERWARQQQPEQPRLVELPAELRDGARWTVRLLVWGGDDLPAEPTWQALAGALSGGAEAKVVVAESGGRYIVGHLLTRQAAAQMMLERASDGGAHSLGALWVHPKAHAAHHIWARSLGIEIDAKDPGEPRRTASVGASVPFEWHIRPGEDLLLHSYWQQTAAGELCVEVAMPDDGTRKVDGVIIRNGERRIAGRSIDWDAIGADTVVEVVEAKQITRPDTKSGSAAIQMVIGQAAAGRAGVAWRLRRDPAHVGAVALTNLPAPESLHDIGERVGVDVVGVDPSELLLLPLGPADVALRARLDEISSKHDCSRSDALRHMLAEEEPQ